MDRRRFLIGSAALLASRARAQTDTINTGFIGTGSRGKGLLRSVLRQPGVKVTAICDIDPVHRDEGLTAAQEHSPESFTDYRRLLEKKDVHAVFIATPADLHVEMAIAAIQAGKHIYCEKPVGITPQSISALLKAARGLKTVFQVGQQMRFGALLRELVPKIHSGALGKILMVKAQRHHGDLPKGKVGEWYFEAKRSGDMIVEQAVHNLDVCNWVINARPERAAGFGGLNHFINDPPGRTTMDHYAVIYEYPGGVRLDFSHVYFHPGSAQPGSYFHIYGSQGMLDLMRATFHPLDRRETETWAEVKPNPAQGEPNIDAFYESIRANRKAAVDLETGAVAALTAILGREAIYTKKVVEWKSLGVQI